MYLFILMSAHSPGSFDKRRHHPADRASHKAATRQAWPDIKCVILLTLQGVNLVSVHLTLFNWVNLRLFYKDRLAESASSLTSNPEA